MNTNIIHNAIKKLLIVLSIVLFIPTQIIAKTYTYDFSGVKSQTDETLWFQDAGCTKAAECITEATKGTSATKYYYKNGDMFQFSGLTDGYYFSSTKASNTSYFQFGKASSVVAIPKYANERITSIKVKGSNSHATNLAVKITNVSMQDASPQQTWDEVGQWHTYAISPEYQLNRLCITVTNANNAQITAIEVTTEPGHVVFYESFNKNTGAGGNDGIWEGSLTGEVPLTDNTGWDVSYVYNTNRCVKIGTTSQGGYIKTPTITLTGNAKLAFKAAASNDSQEHKIIKLSTNSGTLNETSVTLDKGIWKEYTCNLNNVTGSTQITFSTNQNTNNCFFLDEVMVYVNPYNLTISSAKYATLGLPYPVKIPDGVSVYTATISDNIVSLHKMEYTTVIPANTGVIVYSDTPGTYSFTPAFSTTDTYDNQLVAVTNDEGYTCTEADNGLIYYLGLDGDKASFFRLTEGGKIPTYKAYLKLGAALTSAKLDVNFDDIPSNIEEIDVDATSTSSATNAIYNLNGIRVNSNYKGIIIINGKKYLVK